VLATTVSNTSRRRDNVLTVIHKRLAQPRIPLKLSAHEIPRCHCICAYQLNARIGVNDTAVKSAIFIVSHKASLGSSHDHGPDTGVRYNIS
jgi:hypothetical protein